VHKHEVRFQRGFAPAAGEHVRRLVHGPVERVWGVENGVLVPRCSRLGVAHSR
jgi:hypothetical protein